MSYEPPSRDDLDGFYAPQGKQPPNQPQPQNQPWAGQPPQDQQQQGWEQQPKRGQPAGQRGGRKKRSSTRVGCLTLLGVFVLVGIIVGIVQAASGGNNNSPASSATTQPPAVGATTAPPSSATSPAAPPMTASEQSALQAAENYLSVEPGWSYQGLIGQLDSPDGSGFSVADATFAVNNLSPAPNWNQQAAIAAKNYQSSIGGFSACSMVQQLDSPDGGQFTQAQAEYGAQSVGLGSC
jgi:hypothetical protein